MVEAMSERIIFPLKEYSIPWNWQINDYGATADFPTQPSNVRIVFTLHEAIAWNFGFPIYGTPESPLYDTIVVMVNGNEVLKVEPLPPAGNPLPYTFTTDNVASYLQQGRNTFTLRFVKHDWLWQTHTFKVNVKVQSDVTPENITQITEGALVPDIWSYMMQFMMGFLFFFLMMAMFSMMMNMFPRIIPKAKRIKLPKMPKPEKREEKKEGLTYYM